MEDERRILINKLSKMKIVCLGRLNPYTCSIEELIKAVEWLENKFLNIESEEN